MPPITGIIVAGGQSRRLGQDKRKLRLWGERGPTLLEHTLSVVQPLCNEMIVVLNDAEAWPNLQARLVADVYADAGSLGGIYAGLSAATNEFALVVAADMPLLNSALLHAMLAQPREYDALVPRTGEIGQARNAMHLEPMHAVYRRTCLAPLRATLDSGQRRIIAFLERIHMVTLGPEELRRYDPAFNSFRNLNTPEDLAAVQAMVRGHV